MNFCTKKSRFGGKNFICGTEIMKKIPKETSKVYSLFNRLNRKNDLYMHQCF